MLVEHWVAYANVYRWLNLIYCSSWSCAFTSRLSADKWLKPSGSTKQREGKVTYTCSV